MHLLIIGAGYVGLVAAAGFAQMGHEVVCLDINQEKVAALKKGKLPFYEPGLSELVHQGITAQRLHFTTHYSEGLRQAQVCFLAVDTPCQPDGRASLQQIEGALNQILHDQQAELLLVIKSTVPVGTGDVLEEKCKASRFPITIVSNPEFLREGQAVQDFLRPDRIIIGSNHPPATHILRSLYSSFSFNHDRILVMERTCAEISKYASNAMLATRISFMNELAGLCEKMGANIHQVRLGMSSDPRIGRDFLYAGPGFGGSCLPKDVRALRTQAAHMGCPVPLLDAVETVNIRQKQLLFNKLNHYFSSHLHNKTIALLGLSFKPDTDDLREAPSLVLIEALLSSGAKVRAFDPAAMESCRKLYPQVTYCANEYETMAGADAVVLVTEWKQFRAMDLGKIAISMHGKLFLDGRNQYSAQEINAQGLDYLCIGSPDAYTRRHAS